MDLTVGVEERDTQVVCQRAKSALIQDLDFTMVLTLVNLAR